MSIVITGANGEFGRTALLAARAAAPREHVVASVREPARARELSEAGVEVRPGSFDDPEQLTKAFACAETVLINATFFGAMPAMRGQRVASAIQAAADAGAARIVVTSWPDLEHCALPEVQDYVDSEALVKSAGPAWTILRLGYGVADALARDVLWAQREGELVAPAADAVAAPAAVSDLAEAAGIVLAAEGHEGRTYELTGPQAIGWDDLAQLASNGAGREIGYRAVTNEEYRRYLHTMGLHDAFADGLIALNDAYRSGWASLPDPSLADLLGRQPVDALSAVSGRLEKMTRLLQQG